MAGRFFLTLLALLTGLVVQAAPARAGECAPLSQIVSDLTAAPVARVSSVPAALAQLPGPGIAPARDIDAPCVVVAPVALANTVLPGIDRAHE